MLTSLARSMANKKNSAKREADLQTELGEAFTQESITS